MAKSNPDNTPDPRTPNGDSTSLPQRQDANLLDDGTRRALIDRTQQHPGVQNITISATGAHEIPYLVTVTIPADTSWDVSGVIQSHARQTCDLFLPIKATALADGGDLDMEQYDLDKTGHASGDPAESAIAYLRKDIRIENRQAGFQYAVSRAILHDGDSVIEGILYEAPYHSRREVPLGKVRYWTRDIINQNHPYELTHWTREPVTFARAFEWFDQDS